MTMQALAPTRPDLVVAGPDLNIRKGVGYGEDRTMVSYAQYLTLMETPEGRARVRKLAIVMRAPLVDKNGRIQQPGGGEVVAMPAEKFQKWFGQSYRPTVSTEDYGLYEFPAPPPPNRWLPSMVEEAITQGLPIPRELKPPGYAGPVFDFPANTTTEAASAVTPELFRCDVAGCTRFFDSAQGLGRHKTEHKSE